MMRALVLLLALSGCGGAGAAFPLGPLGGPCAADVLPDGSCEGGNESVIPPGRNELAIRFTCASTPDGGCLCWCWPD